MKLTVSTAKFQEMLSKASRGASNNRLLPITTYVVIELKNNTLTLMTTDGTNYLYVADADVQGDDFYVCVETDTIVKLVSKITSDDITFELFDSYLEVKANGHYKLPLQIDDSTGKGGIVISSPLEDFRDSMSQIGRLTVSDIKTILNGLKSSVATTLEIPCYAHYYFGEHVIATDTVIASAYDKSLLGVGETPRLVNVNMVNLLDVMSTDVDIYANDTKMMFKSDDCVIFGTMPQGIENYAIDALNNLFNQQYSSVCSVSKSALVDALDRIRLFVGKFDDGEILLEFADDGIKISSKMSTGIEIVPYIDKNIQLSTEGTFVAHITIQMLYNRVHSFMSDDVEIEFGLSNVIKLSDTDVITVIALIDVSE